MTKGPLAGILIYIQAFFIALWWIVRYGADEALKKANEEYIEARQDLCRRIYGQH